MNVGVPAPRAGLSLVVDASAAQGSRFPWDEAKRCGAVAGIVKATEGENFVDSTWELDVQAAALAGLMTGSYHVFRPSHPDPTKQARFYAAKARPLTSLCPIIDFELLDGLPPELAAERAAAFVEASVELWGKVEGLVYIGPAFALNAGATARGKAALERMASRWKLWVAHYGVSAPTIPYPWRAWTGWQFEGGTARIGDIPVDLSWFIGDELAVAALGATA